MDAKEIDQRTTDAAFGGQNRKTEPATHIPGKSERETNVVNGYALGVRSPAVLTRADMAFFVFGLIMTIGPLFVGMVLA
jgi:hypothetical protein